MLETFFNTKNRLNFLCERELGLSIFSCEFLFYQTLTLIVGFTVFSPSLTPSMLLCWYLLSFQQAISFLSMLLLPSNVNYGTFLSPFQTLQPSISAFARHVLWVSCWLDGADTNPPSSPHSQGTFSFSETVWEPSGNITNCIKIVNYVKILRDHHQPSKLEGSDQLTHL